jgi:hypothetical protein
MKEGDLLCLKKMAFSEILHRLKDKKRNFSSALGTFYRYLLLFAMEKMNNIGNY